MAGNGRRGGVCVKWKGYLGATSSLPKGEQQSHHHERKDSQVLWFRKRELLVRAGKYHFVELSCVCYVRIGRARKRGKLLHHNRLKNTTRRPTRNAHKHTR